jgi:hypothetical protein
VVYAPRVHSQGSGVEVLQRFPWKTTHSTRAKSNHLDVTDAALDTSGAIEPSKRQEPPGKYSSERE